LELVNYAGWPNCVRLTNGEIELIATTDVGPRVIRFGFVGGPNLFGELEDQLGCIGGDAWRCYGGHRFWHAPEVQNRTYWPDNGPVEYDFDGATLFLRQAIEATTGLVKELEISLDAGANRAKVVHRLTNRNLWAIEVAPWCLTAMAAGGRAILPQEPHRPQAEAPLPARPVVLWHYTDMADPRWRWGRNYIQLRHDPAAGEVQRVGALNTRGWSAYTRGEDVFIKRFDYHPFATYPYFECNSELFANDRVLEVNSFGPLTKLAPETSLAHVEHWFLERVAVGASDAEIDAALLPVIKPI
jgi:hypothetical protein